MDIIEINVDKILLRSFVIIGDKKLAIWEGLNVEKSCLNYFYLFIIFLALGFPTQAYGNNYQAGKDEKEIIMPYYSYISMTGKSLSIENSGNATYGSHIAYITSTTPVELNMPLPKDFDETNFDLDYHISVNGANYTINGNTFLYQNHTYIPVRDISEIFHIDVNYNTLDRTVLLTDKEKEIIIAPRITLYADSRDAIIRHGNETAIELGTYYMLVNDRSYVPLRFITETFGFTVDYDNINKQITIKGIPSSGIKADPFSDEQQAIIEAISEYEAKSTLLLKGTIDYLGEDKDIEANINRENVNNIITETIAVKENNGKQYKGENGASWHARSVKISEILSDGTEKPVNLYPFAGLHPYTELSKLKLCGLNKYYNMTIEKDNETEEIVVYRITELNGEKLNILVSIQKNNGSLIDYMETTEFSRKSFSIVYL